MLATSILSGANQYHLVEKWDQSKTTCAQDERFDWACRGNGVQDENPCGLEECMQMCDEASECLYFFSNSNEGCHLYGSCDNTRTTTHVGSTFMRVVADESTYTKVMDLTPDQLMSTDEFGDWAPDCSTESGKAQACMMAAVDQGRNALDMYNGYPFASFDIPDTWTEDFEDEYARGCYYYTEKYDWTDYHNYAFYGGSNAGESIDGTKRMEIEYGSFCVTNAPASGLLTSPEVSSQTYAIVIGCSVAFGLVLIAICLMWKRCYFCKRGNEKPILADVPLTTYNPSREFKHTILVEDDHDDHAEQAEGASYQQSAQSADPEIPAQPKNVEGEEPVAYF